MSGINLKQGVYGGTFDPMHRGHLKIIKESIYQLGLDVLYVVVSGDSWMKKNNVVASRQQRQKMAEITLNNHAKICLINILKHQTKLNKKNNNLIINLFHLKY